MQYLNDIYTIFFIHFKMVERQPRKVYEIIEKNGQCILNETGKEKLHSGSPHNYRQVICSPSLPLEQHGSKFSDSFVLRTQPSMSLVRLYDLYGKEVDLFPKQNGRLVKKYTQFFDMQQYPTFVTECNLIDVEHYSSLFLTKKVNEKGFYRYFVKRKGRYYEQVMDDIIPVYSKTRQPLWGLDLRYPWQIMLLKAWIKQKNSLTGVTRAEPFEFIDHFGLPAYKVTNFKKDIQFIKKQHAEEEQKRSKLEKSSILSNKQRRIIIGKTRDSQKVKHMGLVKNRAAYLISPLEFENGQAKSYMVQSTIPARWVGKMSVVADSTVNRTFTEANKRFNKNFTLEKTFLITLEDMLELFNKFYVINEYSLSDLKSSYFFFEVSNQKSTQMAIEVTQPGKTVIMINLPQSSKNEIDHGKVRYPKIKYFLSKKTNPSEIKDWVSRSRLRIGDENQQEDDYAQSSLDTYHHYDIEYAHGYHKAINQFQYLQTGSYILHAKVENKQQFDYTISFFSEAVLKQVKIINMKQQAKNTLFNSTFYSMGLIHGTEVIINQKKKNQKIIIGNNFDQLGYGYISIVTNKIAQHKLAMRIFPKRLRQAGYELKCRDSDEPKRQIQQGKKQQDPKTSQQGIQKPLLLISEKGTPRIAVMRKIKKISMDQRFPPEGCVEFYRVGS